MKAFNHKTHKDIQWYINERMKEIGSKPNENDSKRLLDRESAVLAANKRPLYR